MMRWPPGGAEVHRYIDRNRSHNGRLRLPRGVVDRTHLYEEPSVGNRLGPVRLSSRRGRGSHVDVDAPIRVPLQIGTVVQATPCPGPDISNGEKPDISILRLHSTPQYGRYVKGPGASEAPGARGETCDDFTDS